MTLLEREAELARIGDALAAAGAGRGSCLLIAGPPGAGKTALLSAAAAAARRAGIEVRSARGSELEREFAFGGARQLLGAVQSATLRDLSPAAAAVLAPIDAGIEAPAPAAFAALEGLTDAVRELTTGGPVVLQVDDAQWLDGASLRWLEYVATRVRELAVVLVIASRAMPARVPLQRLLADPRRLLLEPSPLSVSAVAELLSSQLGHRPPEELATACTEVTGGNPFAVRELIAELSVERADVTAADVRDAVRVPATFGRSVRGRLRELGPLAGAVASAIAVLGDEVPLRRVAALAEAPVDAVSAVVDELTGAGLLDRGRPLRFVHALVSAAVVESLTDGERARLHHRAATQLAEDSGNPEEVAAHLLRSDPLGQPDSCEQLRQAARLALSRGAPEAAVVYLRRARAEPPPVADRTSVLAELGRAELLARDAAAAADLRDAFEQAGDPSVRARIAVDLFDAMIFEADWHAAHTLARETLAGLGDDDPELSLALETRLAIGLLDTAVAFDGPEMRRLEELARSRPQARPLLLLLAVLLAVRGQRCDEIEALVAEGWDGGRFLDVHTSDSILAVDGIHALLWIDNVDAALRLAEAVCADADRRGLVLGRVAGQTHRGFAALRGGDLSAAEADLRRAWDLANEHQLDFTLAFIGSYLSITLVRTGSVELARTVVSQAQRASAHASMIARATALYARALVRLADRETGAAIADLRECGAQARLVGVESPVTDPWRSTLAVALITAAGPADRAAAAEARELVATELALAQRTGVARAVGVALHAQALVGPEGERVKRLRTAVEMLAESPGVYEHAAAAIDLGSALRRAGRVRAARSVLSDALDRAARLGATPLVAAATQELHVAGARPRRTRSTGVDALTASELRVARLAAAGLTNPEIGRELVVTPKTVKHHLTAVYRKLGIAGRAELDPAALADVE